MCCLTDLFNSRLRLRLWMASLFFRTKTCTVKATDPQWFNPNALSLVWAFKAQQKQHVILVHASCIYSKRGYSCFCFVLVIMVWFTCLLGPFLFHEICFQKKSMWSRMKRKYWQDKLKNKALKCVTCKLDLSELSELSHFCQRHRYTLGHGNTRNQTELKIIQNIR